MEMATFKEALLTQSQIASVAVTAVGLASKGLAVSRWLKVEALETTAKKM